MIHCVIYIHNIITIKLIAQFIHCLVYLQNTSTTRSHNTL